MGMMDEVKTKKKLKAAETWFNMAENAKNEEKQIEYYTKSLDANPYNAEAWFRRGRVMEKMGRFNDAQRSFEHAIEIDPDYQGLIGKRTDSFEPSVSSGQNQEFTDFTASEDVYQETETDGEWVTENFGNEDNGFTPPVGDESIFADLGSDQEEERAHDTFSFGGTISDDDISKDMPHEAEQEMTFTAISGMNEEEEEKYEEVVAPVSDEKESNGSIITSEADMPSVSDVQVQSTPTIRKEEKKAVKMPETDRTHTKNMTGFRAGEAESNRTVDVRIPLNETLRFWAVGIVAIIIAFKILEFI
ncbi:MAG: tetratricopeptide repeat protein [Methanolobus sp.]|nr:tetratricopeptide repeat protein [Methanolobus sp.]